VKFGIAAGITGRRSGVGADARDAILVAVEEINQKGGILGSRIDTVVEDTVDQEAGQMTSVFLKLIEREKVDCILQHWGNNGVSEFDIAQDKKTPLLSSGAVQNAEAKISPDPNKYSYVYLTLPSYGLYKTRWPETVDKWEKAGKYKPINHKVGIITRTMEYPLFISNGMKETFGKLGWTVAFEEVIPTAKVEDWSAILSKVRADPPAVVVSTITDPSSDALFIKQFRENPTPTLIYQQASPNDPEYVEMTKGGLSDGVYQVYPVRKIAADHPYTVKFKSKYNRAPSPYGYIMYDATYIMNEAMKNAGDPFNREAVTKALLATDFVGVMGRYKMDPKTHLPLSGPDYIPFPLWQMWSGVNYMVDPENIAEKPFTYPAWYESALAKYKK